MQSGHLRRSTFLFAMLLAGAGLPCRKAGADLEEADSRLRAAGVPEALRERIHASIDRASRFLIARQAKDGGFEEHWKHGERPVDADPIRTTLLCALALRHVGEPASVASARRALDRVLAEDPKAWNSVRQNVRSAALAVLLAESLPDPRSRVQEIASALAGALDDTTGYWVHTLPAGEGPRSPGLESSHVAMLALGSARRQGTEVPVEVFERHVRALAKEQTSTGSWRWHPERTLAAWGHPPGPGDTGTLEGRCIGLANLLVARAALREGDVGVSRLDLSVKRATRHLDEEIAALLADPADMLVTGRLGRRGGRGELTYPRPQGSPGRPGDGAYVKLWLLEQACLFADREVYERETPESRKREERSWYVDGAGWLLDVQDASGGWSPTAGNPVTPLSETDTAYALLFLLRSPSAWHPTAPRPVDAKPPAAPQPAGKPPDDGS